MLLWFVFCVSGKVARVLNMLVFPQFWVFFCGVAHSCLFGFGRFRCFCGSCVCVYVFFFCSGFAFVCFGLGICCCCCWIVVGVVLAFGGFVFFSVFFVFWGAFSHLFSRARKKDFPCFPVWRRLDRPGDRGPKPSHLQVAFSLRERVDLRSQKEGILGKKVAWGRVGRTGQKKEKRMHKKRWVFVWRV